MYDGRVGRWMTTDPYSQYHLPYLAMGNNPISRIDPDGGFDTETAAREYASANGIKLKHNFFQFLVFGFVSNKIVENSDGTFSIDQMDRYSNASITDYGGDLGIMIASMVHPMDVIGSREEGNIFTGKDTYYIRRDGSEKKLELTAGTPPIGPGRWKKVFSVIRKYKKITNKKPFENKEFRLPVRDKNGKKIKYTEYRVDRSPTDAQRNNGAKDSARRLVRGSDGKWHYTHDHYTTFREITRFPHGVIRK